jgi:diphthine synthase
MVLYLVGLGLGDEKDITVRGLETVRKCSKIFLEHYTSVLGVDKVRLEAFYGKEVASSHDCPADPQLLIQVITTRYF